MCRYISLSLYIYIYTCITETHRMKYGQPSMTRLTHRGNLLDQSTNVDTRCADNPMIWGTS